MYMADDFESIDKRIAVKILEKNRYTNKRHFSYIMVYSTNNVVCMIYFDIIIYEYCS